MCELFPVTTPRPLTATTEPTSYIFDIELGTDAPVPPWVDSENEEGEDGNGQIVHATFQPFPSLPSGTNSPQVLKANH